MLSNRTKRNVFGFLSGWLAPPILRSLAWSQSYSVREESHVSELFDRDTNFILAFWHGQMLPALFYFTNSAYDQSNFHTFISPHRDGEYITRAASGLGIEALRTSLRDRQLKALKQIHQVVNEGGNLALTPDGPIGPRCEAKTGIVKLSQRFDIPVLPMAALPDYGKYFSSWDRFCLPAPFGNIQVKFAPPEDFDDERSLEEAAESLQETLLTLTRDVAVPNSLPDDYFYPD